MHFRKPLIFALIAVMASPCIRAEEVAKPQKSAGDFMVYATVERFRIHTDYCSLAVPELKKDLDALMEQLATRVQRIGNRLLASDSFKTLKSQPVPPGLVTALKESNDDEMREYRQLDAAKTCRSAIKGYSSMSDGEIESGLVRGFTGVQDVANATDSVRGR